MATSLAIARAKKLMQDVSVTMEQLLLSPLFSAYLSVKFSWLATECGLPKILFRLFRGGKRGSVAYTEGTTVYINIDNRIIGSATNREEVILAVFGLAAHEAGHILGTDFVLLKKQNEQMPLGYWTPSMEISPSETELLEKEKQFWGWVEKHPTKVSAMLRCYHRFDNIVEDGYVEELAYQRMSGQITDGLTFVRNYQLNSFTPVAVSLADYDGSAVSRMQMMEKVLLCYAKYGSVKYDNTDPAQAHFEPVNDVRKIAHIIDECVYEHDARKRAQQKNICFLMMWPIYEAALTEDAEQAANSELNEEMSSQAPSGSTPSSAATGKSQPQNNRGGKMRRNRPNKSSKEDGDDDENNSTPSSPKSAGSDDVDESDTSATGTKSSSNGSDEPNEEDNASGNGGENDQSADSESADSSQGESDGDAPDDGDVEPESSNGTSADSTSEGDDSDSGDTSDGDSADGEPADGDADDGDTANGQSADGNTADSATESDDSDSGDTSNGNSDVGESDGSNTDDGQSANGGTDNSASEDGDVHDGSVSGKSDESVDVDETSARTPTIDDIPPTNTDDESDAPEYEEDLESLADELDSLIQRECESIAISMAEAQLAQERQALYNKLADEVDYGHAHKDITVNVKRVMPSVDDSTKALYAKSATELEKLARTMAKRCGFLREMEESPIVRKGFFSGKTFNATRLVREDYRYFSKKSVPDPQKPVSVLILVDESGSMGLTPDDRPAGNANPSKSAYARATAIIMYRFCQLVGARCCIMGHTSAGWGPVNLNVNVYTDFDSIDGDDKYRLLNIAAHEANRDGAALRFAGKHLIDDDSEEKILFAITDGAPFASDYGGTSARADTASAVSELRRAGVKVFAAAIGTEKTDIEAMYGDGFIDIDDINSLPMETFQILKRYVRKK